VSDGYSAARFGIYVKSGAQNIEFEHLPKIEPIAIAAALNYDVLRGNTVSP
jgi:hypothetical protein